jgi:hypothetical protein
MQELLTTLLQTVITVAVPILTTFAVNFLRAKAAQATATVKNELANKYISEATDAVATAVLYTTQTYTDTLKKSGTFSKENQLEAFAKALAQAKALITDDTRRFIEMTYGDLTKYLAPRIEAEVKLTKQTTPGVSAESSLPLSMARIG